MEVTWSPHWRGTDERDYEAFVLASPAGHPAQTRAWTEVALAPGWVAPLLALVRDGRKVLGAALVLRRRVAGLGMPWAWIERGPVTSDVASLGPVLRAIARDLRRRGVARLRVMPYWADEDAERAEQELRSIGMRDVQTIDGPHAWTIRLDLAGKSGSALFAGGSREQLRRRARVAEKAGAVGRRGTPDDWTRLRTMHADLMSGQGRRDRSGTWWDAVRRYASDESRGALFASEFQGRTISAAVILRHGPRAVFAWGASVPDHLPFSKALPAFVAAIRWARDTGCTTFDLGGVPLADDPDPKRNAIAAFKYAFDRRRVRLVREHAGWC
jgi:hypothetical protein